MSDISEADVKKIMEVMRQSSDSDMGTGTAKSSDISVLKQKVSFFLKASPEFKPGDVVRWKKD